jgi:hypothetical protein
MTSDAEMCGFMDHTWPSTFQFQDAIGDSGDLFFSPDFMSNFPQGDIPW